MEARRVVKPDFDAIDYGIEQALRAIPEDVKGGRDLWQLRFELRRLQLVARSLQLRGERIKQIARELNRAKKAHKK
jgi:hypothetical protein